jgi:hypothetical protein
MAGIFVSVAVSQVFLHNVHSSCYLINYMLSGLICTSIAKLLLSEKEHFIIIIVRKVSYLKF